MGKDGGGQDEEGEGGGLESRDHRERGVEEWPVLAPLNTWWHIGELRYCDARVFQIPEN